jgi:hypothetical protein
VARWQQAMGQYVAFLVRQQSQNTELAATLTVLELANLLALLERVEAAGDPAAVIDLTTNLHLLFQWLGRPRLQERLARARDAAAQALGAQGHTVSRAAFQAQSTPHRAAAGRRSAPGRLRRRPGLAGAGTRGRPGGLPRCRL